MRWEWNILFLLHAKRCHTGGQVWRYVWGRQDETASHIDASLGMVTEEGLSLGHLQETQASLIPEPKPLYAMWSSPQCHICLNFTEKEEGSGTCSGERRKPDSSYPERNWSRTCWKKKKKKIPSPSVSNTTINTWWPQSWWGNAAGSNHPERNQSPKPHSTQREEENNSSST